MTHESVHKNIYCRYTPTLRIFRNLKIISRKTRNNRLTTLVRRAMNRLSHTIRTRTRAHDLYGSSFRYALLGSASPSSLHSSKRNGPPCGPLRTSEATYLFSHDFFVSQQPSVTGYTTNVNSPGVAHALRGDFVLPSKIS